MNFEVASLRVFPQTVQLPALDRTLTIDLLLTHACRITYTIRYRDRQITKMEEEDDDFYGGAQEADEAEVKPENGDAEVKAAQADGSEEEEEESDDVCTYMRPRRPPPAPDATL